MPNDILIHIKAEDIHANPENLRAAEETDLDGLADTIATLGLLTPLTVHENEQGYAISAGHRRFAAITRLLEAGRITINDFKGLGIPCLIRQLEVESKDEVTTEMLVENVQRLDLTPIEEANGYQRLVDKGVKQAEVAKAVGVSATQVSRRLQLLKLAVPLQELVQAGQLTADQAVELGKLPKEVQVVAAKERWDNHRIRQRIQRHEEQQAEAKAKRNLRKTIGELPIAKSNSTWQLTDEGYEQIDYEPEGWSEEDPVDDEYPLATDALAISAMLTALKPDAVQMSGHYVHAEGRSIHRVVPLRKMSDEDIEARDARKAQSQSRGIPPNNIDTEATNQANNERRETVRVHRLHWVQGQMKAKPKLADVALLMAERFLFDQVYDIELDNAAGIAGLVNLDDEGEVDMELFIDTYEKATGPKKAELMVAAFFVDFVLDEWNQSPWVYALACNAGYEPHDFEGEDGRIVRVQIPKS